MYGGMDDNQTFPGIPVRHVGTMWGICGKMWGNVGNMWENMWDNVGKYVGKWKQFTYLKKMKHNLRLHLGQAQGKLEYAVMPSQIFLSKSLR